MGIADALAGHRLYLAEYEARKDEFDTYIGFLNWKADHSEFVKSIRQKIASAQADGRRG